MANDNLKKPESDSKVPLTQEEKDKRKKIIILIGLIVLVLAILIGTSYYFSSKEKDNDDGKDKNPGNVVKPIEKDDDTKKPEPVVDNNNTNNVIVYRPVKRPEPVIPPVQEIPTTITGSEEDSSISVDFDEETNTINVSGTSKYVAKVNENFGSGFNNIVQVKITLNSKYKREDVKDITVTTDVTNGKKNYFLDDVQEDENGNLYFYWLQAVGKTLDLMPKLTINYGDGTLEEYVMDLSNISIQTPLENGSDLAQALVSTDGNKVVVGGIELNLDYKLTILEEVSVKTDEATKDDETVMMANDVQDENQSTQNPDDVTDPNPDLTNPSDEVKEATDKDYILKVTGIDEENAYTEEAAIKLGFKGYKYIIAVKLYAPEGFEDTSENISKIVFEKSAVDEEGTTVENITSSQSTLKLLKEGDRYYIIVMMAVDGVYPGNNPYVSIDWDGDGNEHGTSRYIFDFSEFNYVDPEVPETPTNPENPPIKTEGDENPGTQGSENLGTSSQSGNVSGNGDVTGDDETLDEEEKLTALSGDTDDEEDKEDDASIDDAAPSGETETQGGDTTPSGTLDVTPDATVPSVEDTGSNAPEVNQLTENN